MITSILIPAHQEETTIGRCLSSLLMQAHPGEFHVIVAANGCTDNTAEIARTFPGVEVIELAEGSKIGAVNAARERAPVGPHIYLDGDLAITTAAARALSAAISDGKALAAIGRMDVDLSHASFAVRQFYKAWAMSPYFDHGKFGGVYALSVEGQARIGHLPRLTNDDEYVSRQFATHEVAFVPQASFTATAPARLANLVKVRTRVRRGNRELAQRGAKAKGPGFKGFLARILLRPHLWLGFSIFVLVNLMASVKARKAKSGAWERDDSSRSLRPGTA
jgi:glycosyltransferase involved in cell wall biosynthesis